MSDKKICPFQSNHEDVTRCDESECAAWREVETGKWDCMLIVKGK